MGTRPSHNDNNNVRGLRGARTPTQSYKTPRRRRRRIETRVPSTQTKEPRPRPRLLRQRRHVAEAAERPRRHDEVLRGGQRERPPRRARPRAKGYRRVRGARDIVAKFINAFSRNEVVWTRGATEAINLVAHAWGDAYVSRGDEIVLSALEHHSNLVPWQLLSSRTGCTH